MFSLKLNSLGNINVTETDLLAENFEKKILEKSNVLNKNAPSTSEK